MSLQRVRWLAREALARSRNYRHAATLRRHLRTKYGKVLPARLSTLLGEVLLGLQGLAGSPLTLLLVLLFVVAARSGR